LSVAGRAGRPDGQVLQHALPVLDFPSSQRRPPKRRFGYKRLRWRQIRENARRAAFACLPKRLKIHNLARP
jgi:hypothetical protein